jgi:hypothetical protein
LGRQNIALQRRDDADDALRSSSGHDAFQEMVMVQGLGHADRQTPWDEEGDRGAGTPTGCDRQIEGLESASSNLTSLPKSQS